jgi:hypothetical protein
MRAGGKGALTCAISADFPSFQKAIQSVNEKESLHPRNLRLSALGELYIDAFDALFRVLGRVRLKLTKN